MTDETNIKPKEEPTNESLTKTESTSMTEPSDEELVEPGLFDIAELILSHPKEVVTIVAGITEQLGQNQQKQMQHQERIKQQEAETSRLLAKHALYITIGIVSLVAIVVFCGTYLAMISKIDPSFTFLMGTIVGALLSFAGRYLSK